MKVSNLPLLVFGVLALAFFSTTAFDPAPLQDICVAINDIKSSDAVFVNGKFCKDPRNVTVNDFIRSGFNIGGNTGNQLGINITLLNVDLIPGLNTNGLSLARLDFAPNGGLNPPHHHPRAGEILTVLKGSIYAGFVTSNPDHRLFAKILREGDVMVFPVGLVHFQLNVGASPGLAIAALSSQNPGVVTESNAIFGAVPSINPDALTKAFHLNKDLVINLQKQKWTNPS